MSQKKGMSAGFDFGLFASRVRVLDGACGTELQRRGCEILGPVEMMNALNPRAVEAVAKDYIRAGSEAILTNSLGANRVQFDAYGAAGRAAELAEASARIARQAAAGTDVKVFGSMGPTGEIVMMGEVLPSRLSGAFAEAAEALAWGGADAIVIETFSELAELRLALEAVRKACDLPVVACMTFSAGPDNAMTSMGNKPAELARLARSAGAAAVGANCGSGPDKLLPVVRQLREACDLPIWVKPNAGLPVLRDRKTVFPMDSREFAAWTGKLIAAGATFVGGCCGTTAEHIRAVRKLVDEHGR